LKKNIVGAIAGSFVCDNDEHLTWEHRSPLFSQEIESISADVFGLAECNNYESFWKPLFEKQVERERG